MGWSSTKCGAAGVILQVTLCSSGGGGGGEAGCQAGEAAQRMDKNVAVPVGIDKAGPSAAAGKRRVPPPAEGGGCEAGEACGGWTRMCRSLWSSTKPVPPRRPGTARAAAGRRSIPARVRGPDRGGRRVRAHPPQELARGLITNRACRAPILSPSRRARIAVPLLAVTSSRSSRSLSRRPFPRPSRPGPAIPVCARRAPVRGAAGAGPVTTDAGSEAPPAPEAARAQVATDAPSDWREILPGVTVSSQVRLRSESRRNARFDRARAGDDEDYLLSRFRVGLTWEPSDRVAGRVELQDARMLGEEGESATPAPRTSSPTSSTSTRRTSTSDCPGPRASRSRSGSAARSSSTARNGWSRRSNG